MLLEEEEEEEAPAADEDDETEDDEKEDAEDDPADIPSAPDDVASPAAAAFRPATSCLLLRLPHVLRASPAVEFNQHDAQLALLGLDVPLLHLLAKHLDDLREAPLLRGVVDVVLQGAVGVRLLALEYTNPNAWSSCTTFTSDIVSLCPSSVSPQKPEKKSCYRSARAGAETRRRWAWIVSTYLDRFLQREKGTTQQLHVL